eukprot:gb/GFBE01044084.1/.p1 GENE.gb/GFBE01044084.1/~~gb/GFBE01044084.1/.p1  ORF type:complete len:211 (+),score=33.24 gb/GFBE01044084.1/:1-633(+)
MASNLSVQQTGSGRQLERLGNTVPTFIAGSTRNAAIQPSRRRLMAWPLQTTKEISKPLPQYLELQGGLLLQSGQRKGRRAKQEQPPPSQWLAPLQQLRQREQQRQHMAHYCEDFVPETPSGAAYTVAGGGQRQPTPRRGIRPNRSIIAHEPCPFEHEKVDDGSLDKITNSNYNAALYAKELQLSSRLYRFMRASNAEGSATLFSSIVSRD